jgi:hypothetical protein
MHVVETPSSLKIIEPLNTPHYMYTVHVGKACSTMKIVEPLHSSRLTTFHSEFEMNCFNNLAYTGPGVTNIKTRVSFERIERALYFSCIPCMLDRRLRQIK